MIEIKAFQWRKHSRDVMEFQREIYEINFPGFKADRRFLRDYGDQIRRVWRNDPTQGLFVLEEDGRACGFLWMALITTMVDPCVGYIKNIYVAPRLRGQGQGKALLSFAERWCARHGVGRISLDASCCNEHAVALYQRTGYEATRLRMEKTIDMAAALADTEADPNHELL